MFSDEKVEMRGDTLHRLVKGRLPTDEDDDVVYNPFGTIISSSANWFRGWYSIPLLRQFVLTFIVAMPHVVDIYLSDERASDRNGNNGLSSCEFATSTKEVLLNFVRGALRKSVLCYTQGNELMPLEVLPHLLLESSVKREVAVRPFVNWLQLLRCMA